MEYEASVDWDSPADSARVLAVYSEALISSTSDVRARMAQQAGKAGYLVSNDNRIARRKDVQRITDVTRRRVRKILSHVWSADLEQADFLSRLYNLNTLPSEDPRFDNAAGDIWQHRVNNFDWDDDWVFDDARFGLIGGDDGPLLRFAAQTLHPAVRDDQQSVAQLAQALNEALTPDGYELVVFSRLSGSPVYGARRRDGFHGNAPDLALDR